MSPSCGRSRCCRVRVRTSLQPAKRLERRSKLRDECLNGEIFYSLKEAQIIIESWRNHYNTKRPHSALLCAWLSPAGTARDRTKARPSGHHELISQCVWYKKSVRPRVLRKIGDTRWPCSPGATKASSIFAGRMPWGGSIRGDFGHQVFLSIQMEPIIPMHGIHITPSSMRARIVYWLAPWAIA